MWRKYLGLLVLALGLAQAQVTAPSAPPTAAPQSTLVVELNVNKDGSGTQMPIYANGEPMQLAVRPSQDAYLYIFNVVNNQLRLILPNSYTSPEVRVSAGSIYSFPAAGSAFGFTAGPSAGVNKVIALASAQPLSSTTLASLVSEAELASYTSAGASLDAAYFQVGDAAPAMAATPAPVAPQAVSPQPASNLVASVVPSTPVAVSSGASGPTPGPLGSSTSFSAGAPLNNTQDADAYNAAVTGQNYSQNTGQTSSGAVYAHSNSVAALGQPLGIANGGNAANNIDYSPYYGGYYANLYRDFYRGLITNDQLREQMVNLSNSIHAGASNDAIALGNAANNNAALIASAAASHASGYNWFAQRQLELFSDSGTFSFTQDTDRSDARFRSTANPWTLYSYLDNQLQQNGWVQNWRRDYSNSGTGDEIVIADYVSGQYQTNHLSLRVDLVKQKDNSFSVVSVLSR